MPRTPRRAPTTVTTPAPLTPTTLAVIQQIPPPEAAPAASRIVSLLRSSRTAAESMDEIRQSQGGILSDAITNHGLHKKAFGWAKQLDRMSPEKINEQISHFLFYIQARASNGASILDRALSAQRLPTGEHHEDAPAVDEQQDIAAPPPARGATVTPFPAQPQH